MRSDYTQLELSPAELAVRKVGANCHIGFDHAYYSVPHSLYGEEVVVRTNKTTVDILDSSGKCVASHDRSYVKSKYVTDPSHMTKSYCSLYDERCYDGAKLRKWAKGLGEKTSELIDLLLDRKQIEEHAYKSCIAILQLSKKYGGSFLETACAHALNSRSCSFAAIQKFTKIEQLRCNPPIVTNQDKEANHGKTH